MRPHTKKLSAIGTAIGLVLMASTVAPAAAAPTPAVVAGTTCGGLDGKSVTGTTASLSGVSLRGGDKIVTVVSPAKTGDTIFLAASLGLNLIFADGPTTGMAFTAPADGLYNLTWSLRTTSTAASTLTWAFDTTCSSTTVSPSPSPSPTATTKPGKGKKR